MYDLFTTLKKSCQWFISGITMTYTYTYALPIKQDFLRSGAPKKSCPISAISITDSKGLPILNNNFTFFEHPSV